MIFRTYDDNLMYVIEAPEGSTFVLDNDGIGELILFEKMTNGASIERRLPSSLVIKAAQRRAFGLTIREKRRPMMHPEVAVPCRPR